MPQHTARMHRAHVTPLCCVAVCVVLMFMALSRPSAAVPASCCPRVPVRVHIRRLAAWRTLHPVADQVPSCLLSTPAAQPAMQPAACAVPWQQCWIQQDMSRACEVVLPESIRVQSRVLLPVLAANLVPMPQGLPHLARLNTAVKVQLMELLVTAAQHPERAEQLMDAALHAIMEHAKASCQKVLDNDRVPPEAKATAQQRTQAGIEAARTALHTWYQAAAASSDVQQLLPVLAAALDAQQAAAAAEDGPCDGDADLAEPDTSAATAAGAAAGAATEAASVRHLQQLLPAGWQLITNAHVTALNGTKMAHQSKVKGELDIVVVDPEGLAVAVVEVKLADANPVMTLVNDVTGLTAVMTALRGTTASMLIKGPADLQQTCSGPYSNTTSSHGAGRVGSSSSSSDRVGLSVQQVQHVADAADVDSAAAAPPATAAVAEGVAPGAWSDPPSTTGTAAPDSPTSLQAKPLITAPFGQPKWCAVEVPVAPEAQAVYVVGRPITEADWQRGLRTMADVAALQLLSQTASTLAAAFAAAQAAARDAAVGSDASPECSEAACTPDNGGEHAGVCTAAAGQLSRTVSNASSSCTPAARVPLRLTSEQQQQLAQVLRKRLQVLQQCQVYSLPPHLQAAV